MKKLKGFSSTAVVICIVAVVFVAIIGIFILNALNAVNYDKYDLNSIITANKDNGFIGDHIKGDPDAPVVIIEYADYQCPLCAASNPKINQAVEESEGNLAVVYRHYIAPYHYNSKTAVSFAEAAGLQGYWKPFSDKLFLNQSEWEYASESELELLMRQYFEEVTDGTGDMEKFSKDAKSEEVAKKISFDMGLSRRSDMPGTPALYIDGQYIDWTNSEGSEVKIGEHTIGWDSAIVLDGLPGLLLKITEIKLSQL